MKFALFCLHDKTQLAERTAYNIENKNYYLDQYQHRLEHGAETREIKNSPTSTLKIPKQYYQNTCIPSIMFITDTTSNEWIICVFDLCTNPREYYQLKKGNNWEKLEYNRIGNSTNIPAQHQEVLKTIASMCLAL